MTSPHLQLVGPMNADPTQPLPADLHTFVEQGMRAGHGALYVSMGTIVQLTEAELRSVAASLSALPNPVIWKLASHDLPSKEGPCSMSALCNMQEAQSRQSILEQAIYV